MNVGIIGSGGREHALCKSIGKSPKIKKIYCFPGNAGTEDIAENIKLDLENFENKQKNYNEQISDLQEKEKEYLLKSKNILDEKKFKESYEGNKDDLIHYKFESNLMKVKQHLSKEKKTFAINTNSNQKYY